MMFLFLANGLVYTCLHITVTVTGTPYTVLGSFSTIFTCCVFSVFTFRSIRIVEVLQIRA
jgi:hypothetical protein